MAVNFIISINIYACTCVHVIFQKANHEAFTGMLLLLRAPELKGSQPFPSGGPRRCRDSSKTCGVYRGGLSSCLCFSNLSKFLKAI